MPHMDDQQQKKKTPITQPQIHDWITCQCKTKKFINNTRFKFTTSYSIKIWQFHINKYQVELVSNCGATLQDDAQWQQQEIKLASNFEHKFFTWQHGQKLQHTIELHNKLPNICKLQHDVQAILNVPLIISTQDHNNNNNSDVKLSD